VVIIIRGMNDYLGQGKDRAHNEHWKVHPVEDMRAVGKTDDKKAMDSRVENQEVDNNRDDHTDHGGNEEVGQVGREHVGVDRRGYGGDDMEEELGWRRPAYLEQDMDLADRMDPGAEVDQSQQWVRRVCACRRLHPCLPCSWWLQVECGEM